MSSAPPLSLKLLNSMNRTGFATALGFAFELSPWVVERAWSERPFASVEALHAAMMDVLGAASVEDKLALIRAHPELASKAAIAKQLTAESNAEQASAGLDRLTPEEFARFHDLNAAYSERFGFPFIIAALKNTREQILSEFERRLCLDAGAAFEAALQQVELITGLRIERMIPVQEERP